MSLLPWQVLKSETLLDRAPWLTVIQQQVRLPNGVVMDDYYLTPNRDVSLIVPLTEPGEVLLVEQYKHGLGRVCFDFPAGYLDTPDEDPLLSAQRELREETGYSARDWTALGAYCLDTNRAANVFHLFLAQRIEQVSAPELDLTENLRHSLHPSATLFTLFQSGAFPSLAGVAAWGLALQTLAQKK